MYSSVFDSGTALRSGNSSPVYRPYVSDPIRSDDKHKQDDFDAAVRSEMARLEASLQRELNLERNQSSAVSVPMRPSPQSSPSNQQSEGFAVGSIKSAQTQSLPPWLRDDKHTPNRRAFGRGLGNLYGDEIRSTPSQSRSGQHVLIDSVGTQQRDSFREYSSPSSYGRPSVRQTDDDGSSQRTGGLMAQPSKDEETQAKRSKQRELARALQEQMAEKSTRNSNRSREKEPPASRDMGNFSNGQSYKSPAALKSTESDVRVRPNNSQINLWDTPTPPQVSVTELGEDQPGGLMEGFGAKDPRALRAQRTNEQNYRNATAYLSPAESRMSTLTQMNSNYSRNDQSHARALGGEASDQSLSTDRSSQVSSAPASSFTDAFGAKDPRALRAQKSNEVNYRNATAYLSQANSDDRSSNVSPSSYKQLQGSAAALQGEKVLARKGNVQIKETEQRCDDKNQNLTDRTESSRGLMDGFGAKDPRAAKAQAFHEQANLVARSRYSQVAETAPGSNSNNYRSQQEPSRVARANRGPPSPPVVDRRQLGNDFVDGPFGLRRRGGGGEPTLNNDLRLRHAQLETSPCSEIVATQGTAEYTSPSRHGPVASDGYPESYGSGQNTQGPSGSAARQKMVHDVYGGPGTNVLNSNMDTAPMQRRKAMEDQRRALEAQIQENKRLQTQKEAEEREKEKLYELRWTQEQDQRQQLAGVRKRTDNTSVSPTANAKRDMGAEAQAIAELQLQQEREAWKRKNRRAGEPRIPEAESAGGVDVREQDAWADVGGYASPRGRLAQGSDSRSHPAPSAIGYSSIFSDGPASARNPGPSVASRDAYLFHLQSVGQSPASGPMVSELLGSSSYVPYQYSNPNPNPSQLPPPPSYGRSPFAIGGTFANSPPRARGYVQGMIADRDIDEMDSFITDWQRRNGLGGDRSGVANRNPSLRCPASDGFTGNDLAFTSDSRLVPVSARPTSTFNPQSNANPYPILDSDRYPHPLSNSNPNHYSHFKLKTKVNNPNTYQTSDPDPCNPKSDAHFSRSAVGLGVVEHKLLNDESLSSESLLMSVPQEPRIRTSIPRNFHPYPNPNPIPSHSPGRGSASPLSHLMSKYGSSRSEAFDVRPATSAGKHQPAADNDARVDEVIVIPDDTPLTYGLRPASHNSVSKGVVNGAGGPGFSVHTPTLQERERMLAAESQPVSGAALAEDQFIVPARASSERGRPRGRPTDAATGIGSGGTGRCRWPSSNQERDALVQDIYNRHQI